jgi:catechol 2,3-dioxygenase-like lactoylglutathione lyase family enzyme
MAKITSKPFIKTPLTPELYCSDIKISLAFYEDTLGFTIQYQREEERFVMLERQGAQIMLEEMANDAINRTWIMAPLEKPFGRGINLEIKTLNIVELYEQVQKSNATIFLPMEKKSYQTGEVNVCNQQFIVLDPDGYMLRFSEEVK